jgi:hypothetical protein
MFTRKHLYDKMFSGKDIPKVVTEFTVTVPYDWAFKDLGKGSIILKQEH